MKTFRRFPIASLTVTGIMAGSLIVSMLRAQEPSTAQSLTGTWIQTVNLQGQPTFQGLITFNADGTLTETDQDDVMPPDTGSPGHGVWQRTGANSISFKMVTLLSLANSSGTPDGMSVSTGTITMEGNNAYQSSGMAVFYSNSGQPVISLPFTAVGKRLMVN